MIFSIIAIFFIAPHIQLASLAQGSFARSIKTSSEGIQLRLQACIPVTTTLSPINLPIMRPRIMENTLTRRTRRQQDCPNGGNPTNPSGPRPLKPASISPPFCGAAAMSNGSIRKHRGPVFAKIPTAKTSPRHFLSTWKHR